MSDKGQLRTAALARRRSIDASTRAAWDRALADHAVELARGVSTLTAYLPMPGEPGGTDLIDRLAAEVANVLLPVLQPDLDLDWARYEGAGSLVAGSGRLVEPAGPRLGPDAVRAAELVLVPAVLVDQSGVRLGRGGGSFDRALTRAAPGVPVVAVLYEHEIVDALPHEPHDRPVTAALTPSGLIRV
jgi:5-formyltetrahydrofolate cyclo-ligase